MLYINLGNLQIEAIQTSKSVVGGPNFIASSIREIPEGIIVDGLVKDENKLREELKELFFLAEPKAIDDDTVSLAISDELVFTHRLFIPADVAEEKLPKFILAEAKTVLTHDPKSLDNFYKVIRSTTSEREVFYTAIEKSTVAHFAKIFDNFGLKLSFLAASSLSIFELVKNIISAGETLLYCDIESETVEYIVLDSYGPIVTEKKNLGNKSFILLTKEIIVNLEKKHDLTVSKIVLAGRGSIKVKLDEVSSKIEKEIVKIGEVIDDILDKAKVKFNTGGKSKMLFATSLGLNLLSRSSSPPNFVTDIELIEKEEDQEKETEEEKDRDYQSQILSEQITEHRRSFMKQILSSKVFVAVVTAAIVFLVLTFAFSSLSGGRGISLPMLSGPSLTPTPTVEPTLTPRPTIDPALKRGDIVVSVQNGTDIAGFAGITGDFLEDKGYKNVERKNADRDDYQKSLIKVKESKKNYLPLLIDDFKEKFDISEFGSLDEDGEFDVLLILGKDAQ